MNETIEKAIETESYHYLNGNMIRSSNNLKKADNLQSYIIVMGKAQTRFVDEDRTRCM